MTQVSKHSKSFGAVDEKPTAIFVSSDEMALGVIHAAQDAGLNVPTDVEVLGFDNTRLALMVSSATFNSCTTNV